MSLGSLHCKFGPHEGYSYLGLKHIPKTLAALHPGLGAGIDFTAISTPAKGMAILIWKRTPPNHIQLGQDLDLDPA